MLFSKHMYRADTVVFSCFTAQSRLSYNAQFQIMICDVLTQIIFGEMCKSEGSSYIAGYFTCF